MQEDVWKKAMLEELETNMQQTRVKGTQIGSAVIEAVDHQQAGGWPAIVAGNLTETVDVGEAKAASSISMQKVEVPAGRAWKPAPGFKLKIFIGKLNGVLTKV